MRSKMKPDEKVKSFVQLIQVAAELLTYYEENRISLRNAMKKYSLFADIENIQSYSQVHALVFETVRFQNITSRIIHQKIQNDFKNEISLNLRNQLRIITYLLTVAPKTLQDNHWKASSQYILTSLDEKYSSEIFRNFFTFLINFHFFRFYKKDSFC